MSIILKGIDLEEITAGNGYARLEIEEDGTVVDDISDIVIGSAIQIPKGHGDIKDVGKIDIPSTSVDMFENCRNCNLLDDEQVKEIIHNAPTILEAEE